MLDGGGARLADAATRHHLTQTQTKRREENNNEQNKHTRTQTIQKTSTRKSTSNRHHTLPSMRNQTPIQQQRTTQTQQCRGRPHNPSLARRIQPSGQRKSPLRKMQQQTRQRQRRKRASTPLPEKRGGTRQTTHRSHANTTHRHMVNHPPPFQTIERRGAKKGGEHKEKRKRNNKRDAMVFGDNVRARKAARALPRTPTQRRRRGRQKEEKDKQRDLTPRHSTTHNTMRQYKTCTVITHCHHNTHTTKVHNTTRMTRRQ